MNLTIDIGNSSIKCGVFSGDDMVETIRMHDLMEVRRITDRYQVQKIAVCSVKEGHEQLLMDNPFLKEAIFLTPDTPSPLSISYDTPESLGMDRLAAAIGAFSIISHHPLLVIDLGTCITYDLVADKTFQGGIIAPGIDLRYKAMNDYTANLPLLDARNSKTYIGKSTTGSMVSGVINGIVGEIEHHISQLLLKYPDLKVFMTGGDAELFESKINSNIFVALEIVQLGLNRVLKENV